MRNSDLTSDTVEVFSWLESDLGYAKKVSRFFDYNIAKKSRIIRKILLYF
jgi:hypothetical protein